jgi:hypothetical protein
MLRVRPESYLRSQSAHSVRQVLTAYKMAMLTLVEAASGQNLTLESRRSGGDAIDRTSGSGPEVNCENRP